MQRRLWLASFSILNFSLTACQPSNEKISSKVQIINQKNNHNSISHYDVTLFSYLSYHIYNVYINKREIGAASSFGGGGLMTGVEISKGPQIITWRDAGSGTDFKAKNIPQIENTDPNFGYLGIHIYPDNTVEITHEKYWPRKRTPRGEALYQQWKTNNGK